MFPTVRRISGRSTRSSTRRSSSRMATRVSRWLPAIRISRFNCVHLDARDSGSGGILSARQGGGALVNLDERQPARVQPERRSKYIRRLYGTVASGGHREAHGVRRENGQLVYQRANVDFEGFGSRVSGVGAASSPPPVTRGSGALAFSTYDNTVGRDEPADSQLEIAQRGLERRAREHGNELG